MQTLSPAQLRARDRFVDAVLDYHDGRSAAALARCLVASRAIEDARLAAELERKPRRRSRRRAA
ncbi:MAG TPA: hypothetical protein VFT76_00455 [Actinomycetota bacterium]|nr:hypothetical protein [Actinomycetota bacterium]